MTTRVLRLLAAIAVVVLLVGACGLPKESDPVLVPKADVPYGLLGGPTSTTAAPTTPGVPSVPATIYLADATKQRLVAAPVEVSAAALDPMVQSLLNRLAVGPTDRQRAQGLISDLGPGSTLVLREIAAGTASIEWQRIGQDSPPGKLAVAVGQIVLTACGVQGVDRVVFVKDGVPVSVPGPAGPNTSEPLDAADYASLMAPGERVVPQVLPLPSQPTSRSTTSTRGP